MFSRVEALGFRSLKWVEQDLGPFHVLVGPNASGKTTFLDVIAFLGDLVSGGLDAAVGSRTRTFQDLVWGRSGTGFELAVEAPIPSDRRALLNDKDLDTIRYEIGIGIDPETSETSIYAEKALLKRVQGEKEAQRDLFPQLRVAPQTILTDRSDRRGTRTVISKVPGGNDNFYSETYGESGKGWAPAFKLGPRRSSLGNLPEDESKFPVSTWFKGLLTSGVQRIVLNSLLIRNPSPPGQVRGFKPDGSNLPWVIESLRKQSPERFQDWIAHLRTALPDIEDITTVEQDWDRSRYLVICYRDGLKVPSWTVSDGTLRLLALTLPAYLPDVRGTYLIEEPENGIHPQAIDTMYHSLSSVYNAQILMATHSPVILSIAEPDKVLCFAKIEGATDIVLGSKHPILREWKREVDLGTLFASGVLG
jgi:predicted ATPase